MTISCIIPAWNLWETTRACLLSLAEHSQGEDVQIIVVDNGSTDATREALQPLGEQLFGSRFTALRLPENQGFARGCNAGARAADGDALFFVNNDITFTPRWLPPLREALSLPHVQAVGPLLLYPDGTCQHCGVSFSPLYTLCHLYEGFPGDHPALRRVHPLQALTGAALLLPRARFLEAGGFHEGYRNGYEDLDLCLTLHSHGGKLRLAGQSLLYHHTSRTPGRFDKDRENAALFSSRWGEKIQPDLPVQAAVDGYEVRLGPTGRSYVSLPAQQAREMDAEGVGMTAAACHTRLREEPLWLGGWQRLAGLLEQQGENAQALHVLQRAARFFPLPDIWQPLHRLALRCGETELAASVCLEAHDDNPARTRSLVQTYWQKARRRRQPMLTAIYERWLREYPAENGRNAPLQAASAQFFNLFHATRQ